MKPTNPQPKKNEVIKVNKGGGEKVKSKSQGCCVIFKPKNYFKIVLSALRMPELRKLTFCIWIRRPQGVRPVNDFVLSFSSL